MKRVLLLSVLFILQYMAYSQDYAFIGQGNHAKYYFDKGELVESVSPDGFKCLEAWIKEVPISNESQAWVLYYMQYADNNRLNSSQFLGLNKILRKYWFDCTKNRYKMLDAICYDNQGNIINSVNVRDNEIDWQSIIPESLIQYYSTSACSYYYYTQHLQPNGSLVSTKMSDLMEDAKYLPMDLVTILNDKSAGWKTNSNNYNPKTKRREIKMSCGNYAITESFNDTENHIIYESPYVEKLYYDDVACLLSHGIKSKNGEVSIGNSRVETFSNNKGVFESWNVKIWRYLNTQGVIESCKYELCFH